MPELQALQSRLDGLGMRDIKLFWNPCVVADIPRSVLTKQLCFILNTALDGHTAPMKPLGDSQRDWNHA